MAKRLSKAAGGELVVCHVLPEPLRYGWGVFGGDPARKVEEDARAWCEAAPDDLVREAGTNGLEARAALRTGVAYQEIVALTLDGQADLIVLGTHGRGGMSRMLLGSVADRVIGLAPCAVLSFREPGDRPAARSVRSTRARRRTRWRL